MDIRLKVPEFLQWAKEINRTDSGHRTELGFMTKKGELITSPNHACHAGLRRGHLGEPKFAAIYSTIVYSKLSREHQLMFIDYMINRSVWANCFINESVQEVIDTCWILDPDQPSNYIAGACFATRWLSEWPHRCKAWVAMVEAGVDENEAMFLSHGLQSEGEGDDLFPIIIDQSSAWHTPLEKNINKTYFNNFVNGKGIIDDSYNKKKSYDDVQNTWGQTYYGDLDYNFFGDIKPRGEEVKVKGKKNLNIFFKIKKKQVDNAKHRYTSHIQIKNLVEDMKEIINAS